MKVILLKKDKKLGNKHEVVEVSDGYATNFLLKNNLAIIYNSANKKKIDDLNASIKAKDDKESKELLELKNFLESKTILIMMNMHNGKPIGGINNSLIIKEIKNKLNVDLKKNNFIDTKIINKIGTHIKKVRLNAHIIANIRIDTKGKNNG